MDELEMECYLEYTDGPPVTEYESLEDFIIRKLKSLWDLLFETRTQEKKYVGYLC